MNVARFAALTLLGAVGAAEPALAAPRPVHDSARADTLQISRLWSLNQVQNLMGTYEMWHTSGFNFRMPSLFANTEDTVIEMMWGRYTGKDASWRCFGIDHRRDDLGTIKALGLNPPPLSPADQASLSAPGGAATGGGPSNQAPFHMHLLTTPVIVIADDDQTARAVWTSPGIEGSGWGWMKYAVDFKRVKGVWKIWHMHVYGLFMAAYDKSWVENPPNEKPDKPSQHADKPPTTGWNYGKGSTYVPLTPEPPQPYRTWGEPGIYPPTYGDLN